MDKIISMNYLVNLMTSINQDMKEMLKALKKEFKSKTGKELTEQELLEKCLQFVYTHSNIFIEDKSHSSTLSKEKINKIISSARNDKLYYEYKSDDELIYGI